MKFNQEKQLALYMFLVGLVFLLPVIFVLVLFLFL